MKKLIALILMAFSMASIAQTITPVAGDYQYNGNVYFQKGLFVPVRDTIAGYVYRVGALSIRPADTIGHPLTVPVYVWTGRRWFNISGGGGGAYTAANGLTLSGSQLRLGGTLDATTSIVTSGFGFNVNSGQASRNTLVLSPGMGAASAIGYNNPDGSFGGYQYVPNFGAGQSLFYAKGFPFATIDYTGLNMSDSNAVNKIAITTDGTIRLKQPNGNYYLDGGVNKFLLMNDTDTTFYVDDSRAQFRTLANADATKVLSTDEFGALKLVTSPGANTIYTGDGSIPDERTISGATTNGISWNSFNAFNINADDGGGNLGTYSLRPNDFTFTLSPSGEPSSAISYGSNTYAVSLNTSDHYNANIQENSQVGQGYSQYQKSTGALSGRNTEMIELQRGFSADSTLFSIRHYPTNWGGGGIVAQLLLSLDSLGKLKLPKYVNNAAQDSVLSADQFGRVKFKYISSAGWDSTKIIDSTIHNQNRAPQTADYAISGVGSSSRYTAFNTAGIPFTRYYSFGHHGVDTLQQRWSIGLSGTPTAPGPGGNAGDSMQFKSYTTSGAFLQNILTMTRLGAVYVPGTLVVGPVNFNPFLQSFAVNGTSTFAGSVIAKNNLTVSTAVNTNSTVTITGDYTVLGTDLYINVNNTANCTITIPTALPGLSAGRELHIKKISNNAFTVTLVVSGGTQTIEGGANVVIATPMDSKTLHDDGSNWFIYQ